MAETDDMRYYDGPGTGVPPGVAMQRVVEENARLRQIIDDDLDGAECLPTCDSYAHDELCPVTASRATWGEAMTRWKAVMEAGSALAKLVIEHWQSVPTSVWQAARHFQAVKKGDGTA